MTFHLPTINSQGILLMAETLHQLIGTLSHCLRRVLYIPGGCLGFLNHQQYISFQGRVIFQVDSSTFPPSFLSPHRSIDPQIPPPSSSVQMPRSPFDHHLTGNFHRFLIMEIRHQNPCDPSMSSTIQSRNSRGSRL